MSRFCVVRMLFIVPLQKLTVVLFELSLPVEICEDHVIGCNLADGTWVICKIHRTFLVMSANTVAGTGTTLVGHSVELQSGGGVTANPNCLCVCEEVQ